MKLPWKTKRQKNTELVIAIGCSNLLLHQLQMTMALCDMLYYHDSIQAKIDAAKLEFEISTGKKLW